MFKSDATMPSATLGQIRKQVVKKILHRSLVRNVDSAVLEQHSMGAILPHTSLLQGINLVKLSLILYMTKIV